MAYAVELFFDAESENNLKRLRAELSALGLGGRPLDDNTRPHISLAVYGDLPDVDAFTQSLRMFARSQPPLTVTLAHAGFFLSRPTSVFLAPPYDAGLLLAHAKYHEVFAQYTGGESAYYLPGQWVPHCTLAMDVKDDKLPDTVKAVFDRLRAAKSTITEVGLIEFWPVKPLAGIPLCEG